MRRLNDVVGATRRSPSVVAEFNTQSRRTQSLARHDDDEYGINIQQLYFANLQHNKTDRQTERERERQRPSYLHQTNNRQ